ncbi:MAG: hypothetical protein AAB853_03160, partial [Patescibacteria group bacterium]
LIRLWEFCGLAWNVKRVSKEQMVVKLKKRETLRDALLEYQQFLRSHVAQAQEELQTFVGNLLPVQSPTSALRKKIEDLHVRYARQLESMKERMLQRSSVPRQLREMSAEEVRAFVEKAKVRLRDAARITATMS